MRIIRSAVRTTAALTLTALGTIAMVWTAQVQAQSFPNKPITLVVGFSPGGSNDIVARAVAEPLARDLGVSVVVENKVGAAGMIGTNHVAQAKPDGYTLMVVSASPLVITPHTHKNVPYDPLKDFAPISLIGITPETLAVNPKVPVHTLKELVALAQKQDVTLASAGTGGLPHLAIELLKSAAGGNIVHVPYKGAAPAVTDTLAGHVNGIVVDLPAVYTQIKDGRLRGIAMANDERSEFLPDLPTSGEQGMPGFVAVNWIGLIAPKNTPPAVIDALHAALIRAMKDPKVKERLGTAAVEISTSETPAKYTDFISEEHQKWGKIVVDSKVPVSD